MVQADHVRQDHESGRDESEHRGRGMAAPPRPCGRFGIALFAIGSLHWIGPSRRVLGQAGVYEPERRRPVIPTC
ncbi:hypothetical protein GCM10010403_30980 [Glycomyces rutgersensis]|uniref:Uncharacterized protein n=1 Tax=Glycomyces rutgersensis TaxID=58115 RepID=A0ABN3FSF2_9ACTN